MRIRAPVLVFFLWPAALAVTPAPAKPIGGEEIRVLQGHRGSVLAVAFSPNGKILASGSRDKTINLWDARTGKLERTLTEHTADVYSVVFSPKGDMLASGSGDKTVRLWDAATAK